MKTTSQSTRTSRAVATLMMIATMTSTAQVHRAVVATGGAVTSNGAARVVATVGQPAIGRAAAVDMRAYLGFWVPSSRPAPSSVAATRDADATISLAPNPATDRVTIRARTGGAIAVRLIDPLGRELARGEGSQVVLDVTDYPAGRYLVEVLGRSVIPLSIVR